MFRRFNVVLIAGILLLLSGMFFSPSLFQSFTSDGKLESNFTLIIIQVYRIFALITGIILIGLSLVLKDPETRKKKILLTISILAFIFILTGIVLSPEFLKTNFTPYGFLEEASVNQLFSLRVGLVSISLILLFAAAFLYIKNYSMNRLRSSLVFFVIFIIFSFIIFYTVYITPKFPANIIFKPSEYSKVYDLVLGKDILLSDYQPKSNLKVNRKTILKAKFPVIDSHFHFASILQTEEDKKVLAADSLVKIMDAVGVKIIVNLDDDGDIDAMLNKYVRKYPDRFINFLPIKFTGVKTNEWLAKRASLFENGVRLGARGLKVIKALGLKTAEPDGKLIPADDPRLDPLWAKAGELGLPLVWHLADPTAFFQPIDKHNERYTQLCRYPEWSFYGEQFPSKQTVLKQRENVLRKHPKTIVIGAHMGGAADDLEYIGYLFDNYPNFYVEISSTLVDLGRQPYTARKFFIKYQDRILFGSDGGVLYGVKGWTVEKFYRAHYEFLETENEFIDYPMRGAVEQGNWKIYGLNLPDEVLEKIYYKNAEKILVGNNNSIPAIQNNLAHFHINK